MGEVTHGADHRWQGIWEHGCMDAMLRLGSKDRNIRAILGAWRVEAQLGDSKEGVWTWARECGRSSGVGDGDEGGGARVKMLGSRKGILCFLS